MELAPKIKSNSKKIMLKINEAFYSKIVPWLLPSLIAFIIIIFFKIAFFRLIYVQSQDMLQALRPGDLILINKFTKPKQNDVIAFHNPKEDTLSKKVKTVFIQRCIAMPGDSIKIEDGVVFVNNVLMETTQVLQFNYHIKTKKIRLDSLLEFKYGITEGGKVSDEFDYSYSLTEAMADSLKKETFVSEIEKKTEKKTAWDEQIYPHNRNYKWNKYNVASFYVPKKGDVLSLDTSTVYLYGKLISIDEDNKVVLKHDSIFINEVLTKTYTVKTNYYFTLGDNRDNAIDSRYWGLLPENNIIGKMTCVVSRNKKGKK